MFPGIFLGLKTQLGMGMGCTGDAGSLMGTWCTWGAGLPPQQERAFSQQILPIASPRGW